MPRKSSKPSKTRIPPEVDHVQVNFCKNPRCKNFGVAPLQVKPYGRPSSKTKGKDPDKYHVSGAGLNDRLLRCQVPDCKESLPLKSNLAVVQEYARMRRNYDLGRMDPAVHSPTCKKADVGFYDDPTLFSRHTRKRRVRAAYRRPRPKKNQGEDPVASEPEETDGQGEDLVESDPNKSTKEGYARWRCKECGATFTISSPIAYQKDSHKNKWIFKLLMNKVPLRRICELVDIDMWTLYVKIDFIHKQCLAFATEKEKKLFAMRRDRAYVCVDRQSHTVNWSDSDRANIMLNVVGSADMKTGFVYATHLNFDPFFESKKVNHRASKNNDLTQPDAWREYARLWLDVDYMKAKEAAEKIKAAAEAKKAAAAATAAATFAAAVAAAQAAGAVAGAVPAGSGVPAVAVGSPVVMTMPSVDEDDDLFEELEEESEYVESRPDVESPEVMTKYVKLPSKNGMQVHEEYVLYAHFKLLSEMFERTGKVRFYMDKESSIRAALHSMFCSRIKAGECDGFWVRIKKNLTVYERRVEFARSRARFKKFRIKHKALRFRQAKVAFIREEMDLMKTIGKWKDRWLNYPFPSLPEPRKVVCFLTDYGQYDADPEHLAWLYEKASMHAIDRFFMQARRRVSMLERPIHSASSTGRSWFGYNAYNPWMIQKFMDIFRVFYNYVKVTVPPPKRKQRKLREQIEIFEAECGVLGENWELDQTEVPKGEADPDQGEDTLAAALKPATPEELKTRKITTPAMRIGLTRVPTKYEDILYFK